MLKNLLNVTAAFILLLSGGSLFGQAGDYSFSVSSSTFTPITGGTDVNSIEADDVLSSSIPIGFNFEFEGTSYTSLKVSSNGFITLGTTTGSSATNDLDNIGGTYRPVIAPLWDDLAGQAANNQSKASYVVTGSAPNRVFTFEWLYYEWSYNSTDSVVSIQASLHETTGIIEFTYRFDCSSCVVSPDASIGLTGASTFLSVTGVGTATPTASNTIEDNLIDTVVTGQVYTFTPPACASPGAVTYSNIKSDSVTVSWGSSGAGPWYVYWGPCGFNQATPGVNIDTVTSLSFIAHGLASASSYEFMVFEDCGSNGFSDTTSGGCVSTTCLIQTLPYSESFSSNLGCMSVTQNGGSSTDTWGWLSDYSSFSGPQTIDGSPGFAFVDSDGAGSGVDMDEILETPEIDASGVVGALVLEFDQYYRPLGDTAAVDVWDGTQWVNLLKQTTGVGSFGNPNFQSIDITAYANAHLKVRFHYYEANYSWYWGIDNLLIHEVLCQPSTMLSAYAVASDSIAINWKPGAGLNYGVEYGSAGFTPGTGMTISTTDTFAIIKNLSPLTSYDVYVYDTCTAGNSLPLGPVTISTSCVKQSLPFTEPFHTGLGCFVVTQNGGTSTDTWQWVGSYSSFSGPLTLDNDTGFAFVDSDAAGSGIDMDEILESPSIDASSVQSGGALILEFDQFYQALGDTSAVDVWDGTQWVNILKQTNTIGAFGSPNHQFIDVTAFANADFKVRFHYYEATYAWYWAIDNFSVTSLPCGIASALDTGLVTSNSAELTWTSNSSMWNILWGPQGFNQASGNGNKITGVTTNPYSLAGLGADSCYSFYVQDTCSGIGSGPWVGPFNFCTPPTCPAPTNLGVIVGQITATSAYIYWTSGGASNYNVEYDVTGFTKGTGMTLQVTNDTIMLTGLASGTTYQFYVRDSCSATDTSLWVGPVSFSTPCLPQTLPYFEDFASSLGCFTVVDGGSTADTWMHMMSYNGSTLDGTPFAFVDSDAPGSGNLLSEQIVSVQINASGITYPLILEYDQYFNSIGGDSAIVEVFNGTSWVQVAGYGSDVGSFLSPDHDSIDISAHANANLQVRFRYEDYNTWAWYWAVDNVSIKEALPCQPATSVVVSNESCDMVDVSWVSDPGTTSSYIEYGATGFVRGTGTVVANVSSPYTISGLTLDSDYDVYVVDSCALIQGNPSGVVTFKTDSVGPVLASFSYTQSSTNMANAGVDFDGSASTGDGLTFDWDYGNGNTGTGVNSQGTYTSNGTYSVVLTVTDRCGNTDDTTIVITVAGISIVENEYNAGIEIYPNPSNGTFKVNVTDGSKVYAIEVVDLSGRVVYQKGNIATGIVHKVELQNKAKGVYMVRLKGEGLNVTQRIVID